MATENEDIKKEGADNREAPKHHSWLDNIIDRVQDLDTDFPLSGGEEDPRPARHHTEKKPEPTPAEPENKEEEKPHHQSFIRHIIEEIEHKIGHIDTDFPLSGGEE